MKRSTSKLLLLLVLGLTVCIGCSGDDGTGDPQTNAITINPEPDSLDAPWQITGPGGFDQSGDGDLTLTGRAAGTYMLAWGSVSGWTTPTPAEVTQVLATGGSLTFSGTYVE